MFITLKRDQIFRIYKILATWSRSIPYVYVNAAPPLIPPSGQRGNGRWASPMFPRDHIRVALYLFPVVS
jgi:hypothetical protein